MPGPQDIGFEKRSIPQVENVAEKAAFESSQEKQEKVVEKPDEAAAKLRPAIESMPSGTIPTAAAVAKDEVTLEVEKILEDDLGAYYASLPPEGKLLFKNKGEQASREIAIMVRSLNLNFKRALQLIRDWLLTIPGVNKFFLEQEAKIKLDRLKELVEVRREEATKQP